jgi:Effector protein/RTX calcium-binding nonapeptide repeat (4 copies)
MAHASARPDNLDAFALACGLAYSWLIGDQGTLAEALDAFRATDGCGDFMVDVTPRDIDLAAAIGRLNTLGGGVAAAAAAFRVADTSRVDGDGLATVDDESSLGVERLVDLAGPSLVRAGGMVIVHGTEGADHVQLRMTPDGGVEVLAGTLDAAGHIAYERFVLTPEDAAHLVVRTGGQNDVITVDPSFRINLTVWSGDGDDLIGAGAAALMLGVGGAGADRLFGGGGDDRIFGGAGDDEIDGGWGDDMLDGQDGDDRLAAGGGGDDTIYGGRGRDRISGGYGDDYLEGGDGDDVLVGGRGDDILSGGRRDDVLRGGDGDDVLVGGRGDDGYAGGAGSDQIYASPGDSHPLLPAGTGAGDHVLTIALEGSPGEFAIWPQRPAWMSLDDYHVWTERLDSDLELIRSTPHGRAGLIALDEASEASTTNADLMWRSQHVMITPYVDPATRDLPGSPASNMSVVDWMLNGPYGNYSMATGTMPDSAVRYDANTPTIYGHEQLPGPAVLFHELAHSYDQISGGVPPGDYTEVVYDRNYQGGPDTRGEAVPIHRAEWNAVGHDLDGDGRIDTLPTATGVPHPEALTENALRGDLGLPERKYYQAPISPVSYVRFEDVTEDPPDA